MKRARSIAGAQSAWYRGGLCAGESAVAISSTVDADNDFGVLERPLSIRERSAFLVVLKHW